MVSLTVWKFPTPLGVDAGELRLRRLEELKAITVHDAAALIWMPGAEGPTLRHLRHRTAKKAGKGSLWGALVGVLVAAPVAGAAVGAAAGGAIERLRGSGIDEEFVADVRTALTPGTSALLLLSSDADPELVVPAVRALEATLLRAELGDEVPQELRDLLPPTDDPST
jgi:uncharacterized membrane protein